MRIIFLVSLIFQLAACVTNGVKQYDVIDDQMYKHLKQAANWQESGDYDKAIDEYYKCLSLKPEVAALNTSQPRRWCQNNIVNLLIDCERSSKCNTQNALHLAQELVEFNPIQDRDVAYSGTLAKAYAANGNYRAATKEMKRVVGFMGSDHEWRASYISLLQTYREKLDQEDH